MTYPDGTTQKLLPSLHDLDEFKELLETSNVNYRIVPSTGVIEILDVNNKTLWKGKPDFYLSDSPGFSSQSIYFEHAGDVNYDGLDDVYMITKKGKQIIYSLSFTMAQ